MWKEHDVMRKKKAVIISAVCAVVLCAAVVFCAVIILNPPEVRLVGGENITVEVLAPFEDPGAELYGSTGNLLSVPCVTQGKLNASVTGSTIIKYVFTYRGKEYSAERVVNVKDTTPPEIVLSGESEYTLEHIADFSEPGYSAADKYEGDVTSSVTVTTEEREQGYTVVYTVADSSGNTSSASRTVVIADLQPPVITVNGYKTVTVPVGSLYEEKGAYAVDSFEGDITSRVVTAGSVDTAVAGEYTVTYSVSDSAGHSVSASRKVRVVVPDASGGTVYLTFDDGPSVSVTTRVLDILAANNVKATFFLVNYDTPEKEALVRRMAAEGHSIGIHGYSHDYKAIYASEEAFMNNIYSMRDKIAATTGVAPDIMRFPGGSSNKVSSFNPGIMTRLCERVRNEGFTYYDWNVSSSDAQSGGASAAVILRSVQKGLMPGKENIVLMHDSSAKGTTADALQGIIDYCNNNGYTMLPITSATPAITHRVNN